MSHRGTETGTERIDRDVNWKTDKKFSYFRRLSLSWYLWPEITTSGLDLLIILLFT